MNKDTQIYDISLRLIDDFPDHPYKVQNNEDMHLLTESIRTHGVITPAVVRKKEDGRYEMISGHRRMYACGLAGLETIRCRVVNVSREEAILMMVDTKLLPYFGKMQLNEITVTTVRQWQNTLITHPANYSPTYLKSIHNQLSAIMNFAVKFYGLAKNPAAICGSMGKKHADSMLFWTVDEFNTFIATVDDIRIRTIFYLLFYSGIREGEMLALTLNDFDFTAGTMSINKNFAVVKGREIIKEPKTPKSKRVITIPRPVLNIIQEYVKTLYDYDPRERLFPIAKSSLVRHMVKYSALSGVKRIRIHDLRHSHASMLIELGVPPLAISERLGHEDIQTTLNVYSHLYPNKQHEIAQMLATQLFPEKG